jgi:pyruvate/2-oxoglutarate dehydrogenase complex dihydrolipoamide acyltransferase (E2) component
MSRVYSVKSNARRDARKLGLDPELVAASGDGWIINYPDTAAPKKMPKASKPDPQPAPKATKAPRAAREGDPKRDRLIAMLADWTPISELMSAMGWQAHTVRGALSTAAKTRGIKIERQRVAGVTSYRVSNG